MRQSGGDLTARPPCPPLPRVQPQASSTVASGSDEEGSDLGGAGNILPFPRFGAAKQVRHHTARRCAVQFGGSLKQGKGRRRVEHGRASSFPSNGNMPLCSQTHMHPVTACT